MAALAILRAWLRSMLLYTELAWELGHNPDHDLPDVHFSTNGHLKATFWSLQDTKPLPHRLAVDDRNRITTNHAQRQHRSIRRSQVTVLPVSTSKSSRLALQWLDRAHEPLPIVAQILPKRAQSSHRPVKEPRSRRIRSRESSRQRIQLFVAKVDV